MPRLALNRKSGIRLAPEAVSQGWIAFPGLAPPGLDAIARVPRALAAGAGAQEEELTAEDAREELALWLSRLAAEEDQARAEAAAAEATA